MMYVRNSAMKALIDLTLHIQLIQIFSFQFLVVGSGIFLFRSCIYLIIMVITVV